MLRVSASNQAAADSLNEMLDLHSSGEIGLSFFVNGTGSDWQEWKSLAVLPVGYFGTADRLAGLGSWLSHVWIGPDGDVSRAGTEPAAWSFPRYIHGLEYMKGYEFNSNGDTQGWTLANSPASTPNGGTWLVATPNPDPQMERGGLSFDTSHAAFVEVRMRTTSQGQSAKVYWQRTNNSGWSEARSWTLPVNGDGNFHNYRFPVYKSPEWNGVIKRLRFDPIVNGGPGQSVEVDRIVADYDSRAATTNSVYVLSAWRYYAWTGRAAVFTLPNSPQGTVLNRARLAMRFLQTELGGDSNSFILVSFRGHDGLPGKVNGQLNKGHGIQSTIHDGLPIGHQDAHSTVLYYAALRAMSELELEAERHPEWGVVPNPYGETSQTYSAKADAVRAAIVSNFWLAGKGRLMLCRDINNVVRDYGHTATNLMAAYYGALDDARAEEVLEWISGDRIVAGDLSQGSDIYHWSFVPRMTTQDTVDWYVWPMYMWFGLNTAPGFGDQVQNGGAWSYSSFYDIVDRARYRGADDAWARMLAVVDWFDDTRAAGGYENYYATHDGDLQCYTGEGQGSVGLQCEFPESVLVPISFAYTFLGIDASIDGLHLRPALPSALTSVGLERLYFRGYFYDVVSYGEPALVLSSHEDPESPLPNSPRVLNLNLEGLLSGACYQRTILDTAAKTSSTNYSYSDAQGRLIMALSLPAQFSLTVSEAPNHTWCGPPEQ